MSADIVVQSTLPAPREPIAIRPGCDQDIPAIDALQKMHSKALGFMPRKALEGKIRLGQILVAIAGPEVVGYLIGSDQYFKHDDVGIIYQINVAPGKQRGFIGAALLKAQFDRSAYGCKLYCCWCAQDLAANRFWEAMGFVPLAFRAGSEKKRRTHIFWQKRIRGGDTATAWWFPSETKGGSMMEDRLVFPIPPDMHWSDAKPIVLPQDTHRDAHELKQLQVASAAVAKKSKPVVKVAVKPLPLSGGLQFAAPEGEVSKEKAEKPRREKKAKIKNDPKYVAAARELRDRWLEHVNAAPLLGQGKYDVSRAIGQDVGVRIEPMKLLSAA